MISVIVPVYNAEKFIKRCIDSILCQTYKSFELVLVNDGSKDRSLDIMQEYADNDSRIKIYSQENKGVAAARNTGLLNSTGDYILYVDSDDWIEPDALERLLTAADCNTDIVFCSSDNAETPDSVKSETDIIYENWDNKRQILEFIKHKRMSGMLWNKLIKRCLTDGIFFNEKTGYGEDAEFLWQVLKRSQKMILTNEILYHHVLEDTSISHLSYSEKKFSAIPMWESICADVEQNYHYLLNFAKVSLMSAAVFGLYEAKCCGYKNKEHIKHMRKISRKYILLFLKSEIVSKKFKLYAIAACLGY